MLAQAIDLPTSVRLARTKGVDLRLFRCAPRLPPTKVCYIFFVIFIYFILKLYLEETL